MLRLAAALALGLAAFGAVGCATVAAPDPAQIRAGNLGATQETAIKVSSVKQEYEIIRSLGLVPAGQALSVSGRNAYDVMTVRDPRSGEERQLWFDISAFYGRF